LYNQSCIRLELFAKQYAANTKKIEKGIPGTITPIYAIPSDKNPIPIQIYFLINFYSLDAPFTYTFEGFS